MSVMTLDLETTVSNAVDASLTDAFATMTSTTVSQLGRCKLEQAGLDDHPAGKQITALVSLSGDLNGSIGICLSLAAARLWTRELIDHDAEDFDQTVVDAVGELANIVVGGTKRRLSDHDLKIGLPNVVKAGQDQVVFPGGIRPLFLHYVCEGHSIGVFVALAGG